MHENNILRNALREILADFQKKIIIYGAHLVASELYRYIFKDGLNDKFIGFAVTSKDGNPNKIEGQPVKELTEYESNKNIVILVAMPKKYHDEVINYARKTGFSEFICIAQEDMEILKGEWILKNFSNEKYCIYEDEFDKSWLNIVFKNIDISPKCRHYKFPTLYYMSSDDIKNSLYKFNFIEDYKRNFGEYRNIHNIKPCTSDVNVSLKIYMVFSQWDNGDNQKKEYPDWIVPIQAGSAIADVKIGTVRDDVGENISFMNRNFAELTAAYWIWKNDKESVYKGICHYRRHFVLSKEEKTNLLDNNVDVILTTPRYVPGGIKQMFLNETPVKLPVLENLLLSLKKIYPEESECFEKYINEVLYVPNNMVVAKNHIYDSYCEWLFPILFDMFENDKKLKYGHENDRHIAYAAEILTSYYFAVNNKKFNIYHTDYRFI